MAKDFELGKLVWAKMKGYPPWPAKIIEPREDMPAKTNKDQHFVFFFGTHDVAWVVDENIHPHSNKMVENSKHYKKKPPTFLTAVEEIKQESLITPQKVMKDKDNIEKPISISGTSKTLKKIIFKKGIVKPTKRKASEMIDYSEPGCSKVRHVNEDYAKFIDNISSCNAMKLGFDEIYSRNKKAFDLQEKKPEEPFLPSNKKFGFIGLGVMGGMIVKNLLLSGHDVTVWNRTAHRCEEFRDQGAKVADTPAEVIRLCDITFSCLEDAEAVKDVVFQKFGVREGFSSGSGSKGYVELTSIDPTTSQEVCEAISGEGGRYLEAPLIGSRQSLSECAMGLLVAGDHKLFTECSSCFTAIATRSMFLGKTPGLASKVNLLTSMVYATSLAALAECLTLVKQCGIDPAKFLTACGGSPVECKLLMNKGQDMITMNEKVEQPIKHLQKDLDMAVALSNDCDQPIRVTMMANEMFKRAMRINPEGDISSIYQCY